MEDFGKLFIILGIVFITVGIFWQMGSFFKLGKLPGDLSISKENFKLYIPITSSIIISIILSLVFWIINKYR